VIELHHLAGQLDPESRDWRAVRPTQLAREDLVLPGADIHYCLFEIPMQDALRHLPPGLHPAIPAVLGITFIKAPESPLGPLQMAIVGIACRSGIRPRYMTLAAFTDSAAVAAALQSRWGFPARVSQVTTHVYYDQVLSTVAENGRKLLEVATGHLVMLTGPGASVVYCPALNMADLDIGRRFIQVDFSAEFKRVARGEPTSLLFDGRLLGDIDAAPSDPVSGTLAKADLTIHPVRFVADPMVLAENGGASKLAAAK